MPTKTTKKTSTKNESATKNVDSKKKTTSSKSSIKVEKKESSKKGVVKRRKLDLTPTRASAVAIASQANREKKKALIEKFASDERVYVENRKVSSSSKIPLWVWVFFWCSLLLFCVSFYQAIIRPQLEEWLAEANIWNEYVENWDNSDSLWENWEWDSSENIDSVSLSDIENESDFVSVVPATAVETIQEFFRRLSAKEFDSSFELFTPAMQRSSEIREHFTSFRMNPFISWIQWDLTPTNFQYVDTSAYWRDRYSFDLSYVLNSNQERYDETWEFIVDTTWDEPKIATIVCTTSRCSYHPIFWPENFGMMR